jgi:hypothetical protein
MIKAGSMPAILACSASLSELSTMSRLHPSSTAMPRSMSFATSIPMPPGSIATLSNPIPLLSLSEVTACAAVIGCVWDLGIGN